MNIELKTQLCLYKRRIFWFSQKYNSNKEFAESLEAAVELIDIIPSILLSHKRLKLTSQVNLHSYFSNVILYLNWLDSLVTTIRNEEYFVDTQSAILIDTQELSLEEYLSDTSGMVYYPDVIIENIRNKIMIIQRVLNNVPPGDIKEYYQRRIIAQISIITQPIFAIGEMAALRYE